jgi:hypothetical protein
VCRQLIKLSLNPIDAVGLRRKRCLYFGEHSLEASNTLLQFERFGLRELTER